MINIANDEIEKKKKMIKEISLQYASDKNKDFHYY